MSRFLEVEIGYEPVRKYCFDIEELVSFCEDYENPAERTVISLRNGDGYSIKMTYEDLFAELDDKDYE